MSAEHRQSAESDYTTVVRVRLPRDRSFIYLRLDRTGWRVRVHAEVIQRRYYSPKRVEIMRFGPPERRGCDCRTLCSMGPTCPGAILAGLDGAGCHRVTRPGQSAGGDVDTTTTEVT